MLEEFGCQVISANSGEQGLRMAREFRPQLITVDLLMPQMDGASVIRALKADPQLRAIPLVVVSLAWVAIAVGSTTMMELTIAGSNSLEPRP